VSIKAVIDVTSIDHIVGDSDTELKLIRDEDGEVAIIFAVEDTIVRLSPVSQLLSYISHLILEDAYEFLQQEEPKPDWRAQNKDK